MRYNLRIRWPCDCPWGVATRDKQHSDYCPRKERDWDVEVEAPAGYPYTYTENTYGGPVVVLKFIEEEWTEIDDPEVPSGGPD